MKDYLTQKKFKNHDLNVPRNAGKGLTEWIATCSCGNSWRCYYSRYGLEWLPLNEQNKTCPYNR